MSTIRQLTGDNFPPEQNRFVLDSSPLATATSSPGFFLLRRLFRHPSPLQFLLLVLNNQLLGSEPAIYLFLEEFIGSLLRFSFQDCFVAFYCLFAVVSASSSAQESVVGVALFIYILKKIVFFSCLCLLGFVYQKSLLPSLSDFVI